MLKRFLFHFLVNPIIVIGVNKRYGFLFSLMMPLFTSFAYSQELHPKGLFDFTANLGETSDSQSGQLSENKERKLDIIESDSGLVYELSGKGKNLSGTSEDIFYAFTQRSGSWTITCKLKWNPADDATKKTNAGIMIREEGAVDDSAFYALNCEFWYAEKLVPRKNQWVEISKC